MSDEIPQRISVTTLAATDWIRLEKIHWRDKHGKVREWDRAVRPTSPDEDATDAAATIALRPIDDSKALGIVLVAQYRPPVDAVTLEFPAGLVDRGEDNIITTAVRETREETGYIIEPLYVSPRLVLSPGMGNESMQIVLASIDMGNERNQKPVHEFDEGEDLETLVLPLKGLRMALDELAKERGFLIFDSVYTFAMGLELAGELDDYKDTIAKIKKIYG